MVCQKQCLVKQQQSGDRDIADCLLVLATVGPLFAGMSFDGASGNGVWTLQPTDASLKYRPPPGFQAFDGGPVTPSTSVWSASDAAANAMTLSNGGLTVVYPGRRTGRR